MGCLKLEILNNHKPALGEISKNSPAKIVRIGHFLRTKKGLENYYPFGMAMGGRKGSVGNYRYGYQGSEKDDEIKGQGNYYTTFFRGLDPRLGKWLSVDPKASSLPWQSPYCSMDNNPIFLNDVLGDKADGWVEGENGDITFDENIHSQAEADKVGAGKYLGENIVAAPKGSDEVKMLHSDGTISDFSYLLDEVSIEVDKPAPKVRDMTHEELVQYGLTEPSLSDFLGGNGIDYNGLIQNSTPFQRENYPVSSFFRDLSVMILNEVSPFGLIDDASVVIGNENTTTGDKIAVALPILLSTKRGVVKSRIGHTKIKVGTHIDISEFSEGKKGRLIHKSGYYLERDRARNSGAGGHGGSEYKLKNKKGDKLYTVSKEGKILR